MKNRPPMIGVTPRVHRGDSNQSGVFSQTLHIAQASIAECLHSAGALAVTLPLTSPEAAREFALRLDGLLLQGGADLVPQNTAVVEQPLAWRGDLARDASEMALFDAFYSARKPILGICRGMQLINVALGGTLFQDLPTQTASDLHDNRALYSAHRHDVSLVDGGFLQRIFQRRSGAVNSIHHQGIDQLALDLEAEAHCAQDGLIEAVRHRDPTRFIVGVQWHPELMQQPTGDDLPASPLFSKFVSSTAL